jgi:hypothetical protein
VARWAPNARLADFADKSDVGLSAADDADVPAKLKAVLASGQRLKLLQISRPPGQTASMELPDVIPRNDKDDGYRNGQQRHLRSHVVGQTMAMMFALHCHRISPQAFSARAES